MTKRVQLQLDAIVSDDGTRCATECPHRNTPDDVLCMAFRVNGSPTNIKRGRAPACIAAEQAAASPLVCMCATMARDPQVPGWQMCPRCTIAHDAIVDEWTRIGSLEDAVMREIAAVGGPVVREVGGPVNVAASVAATIARLGEQAAASVPSCEGARGLDASEALREARVQGMREALEVIAACDDGVSGQRRMAVATRAVDAAIEAVRKGER